MQSNLLSPHCLGNMDYAITRPEHIPDVPIVFEIFPLPFVGASPFLSSTMRVRSPDDCVKSYENGWNCLTVDLHGTIFYCMRQVCDTSTTSLTIHQLSQHV